MSTGPHWELGRLKPITEQEMILCYNIMVRSPLFHYEESHLSI